MKQGVRSKHNVKLRDFRRFGRQQNKPVPRADLRAHLIRTDHFLKNGHFHSLNLCSSQILIQLWKQKHNWSLPWRLSLSGSTLSSPLQVYLRLQCQVLKKRTWAPGPQEGHVLWFSEEQTARASCLLHLVCNGYAIGWEEVQGDTESIQFYSYTTAIRWDLLPYTNWSSFLNTRSQFCQL